jgi:hypothetical protein
MPREMAALAMRAASCLRGTRKRKAGNMRVGARAALDFGATFQLHSGAWRAWPAPVEEEPVKAPVALSAPEVRAGVAPDQSAASMQQTAERERATALPTVAAGFVTFPEPAAPPAAKAPTPPPPPVAEGRMALGGPEGQGAPAPAARPDHSAPRTHDRAPETDAAAASDSKFGPAIFKQFDGKGS